MKKVSKLTQVYYSVTSVVALALIWSGVYVSQGVNQLKSSASQFNSSSDLAPTISLVSADDFKDGKEATINIDVEPGKEPVLSTEVHLIYDPVYIEVKSVDSIGILGSATTSTTNPNLGTVDLEFSPLSGVAKSGSAALIKVLAKQKGNTTVTYSSTQPTLVSTPSNTNTPQLNLINLTID